MRRSSMSKAVCTSKYVPLSEVLEQQLLGYPLLIENSRIGVRKTPSKVRERSSHSQ